MARKVTKIVVVDERPGMSLAAALHELDYVRVCAEVGTAAEAVEAVETLGPQALVLDVSLPRLGGLGLVRALRRLHPEVAVVAVTPDGDRRRAAAALKAGAKAYLLREGAAQSFLAALDRARAGKSYVDRRIQPERIVLRSRLRRTTAA